MIIWFAGVPGGPHSEREEGLREMRIFNNRLITFFYKKQALTTLKYFAGSEKIPSQNDGE